MAVLFQIGFPQAAHSGRYWASGVIGRFPLSINLLMRFVLLSRPASFCGSSPALKQGSFHTGLGFGISGCGFLVHLLAGFLGSFTMICSPPCKLGGCDGVGFRLGFQFLVCGSSSDSGLASRRSVSSGVSGLACVQCGGKLFQRSGLGRLCRFLPLIPCLVLAVLLVPVGGKALCFLRREVGSGLLQRGKLL